jgi:hypothetical protein
MYNTGTILKTNCHNIPFCFHLAICENVNNKILVWHCTPTKENSFGGNIICEDLNEFLKSRNIKNVIANELNSNDIASYVEENKTNKWTALKFNCETFINEICNKKQQTTQLAKAICICGFVVGAYHI